MEVQKRNRLTVWPKWDCDRAGSDGQPKFIGVKTVAFGSGQATISMPQLAWSVACEEDCQADLSGPS
jgi:hypothetical protein